MLVFPDWAHVCDCALSWPECHDGISVEAGESLAAAVSTSVHSAAFVCVHACVHVRQVCMCGCT